jgi:prefoldin subunit 5
MTKKTVKELTKENADLKESFDELMEQAQGLQALATNRLVYIRLLESFANDVNNSMQKLQRDLGEIQGPQQEEQGEG